MEVLDDFDNDGEGIEQMGGLRSGGAYKKLNKPFYSSQKELEKVHRKLFENIARMNVVGE